MEDQTPLERAIKIVGTQTAFAAVIGRPQQTVSEWMKRGWPAPEACLAIERITGVPVSELLQPAEQRKRPKQKPKNGKAKRR